MGKSNGCLLGTDQVLSHTGWRGCEYRAILGVWGRILQLLSPQKKLVGVWVGGACFTRTSLSALVWIKIFGPKEKGDQVIIVSNLYLDQVLICRLGKNCSND